MRRSKYLLMAAISAAICGTVAVSASANEIPAVNTRIVYEDVVSQANAAAYELKYTYVSDYAGYMVSIASNPSGIITVDIPATYTSPDSGEVYPVVAIGSSKSSWNSYATGGFTSCTQLKAITIPASVKYIARDAFSGCTGLQTVTFASGSLLETIDNNAFKGCTALKDVTFPSKLTTIGQYAFSGCNSMTSVTVPGNVKTIGYAAFYNCDRIQTVTIKKGVETIGTESFQACDSLNTITVQSGTIGEGAFRDNDRLRKITLSKGVKLSKNCFRDCPQLGMDTTKVTLPSDLTEIPESAFQGCVKVKQFVLPSTLTSIGRYAFSGCTSLASVDIPGGVATIPYQAFYNCITLNTVTLNSGLTQIGSESFYGCKKLTSINIPKTVTELYSYAFASCTALTTVKFNNNDIDSIPEHCFDGCTALESVNIPTAVNSISDYAFRNCSNLASVSFSKNLTDIGRYTFYNCDALKTLFIPANVNAVGYEAFYDCDGLTSVTVDNIMSLGSEAFAYCDNLTYANVSANDIYSNAFYNCSKLKNLTLTDYVQSLGDKCFYGCSSLVSVVLPNDLLSIPYYSFNYCSNLETVTIPKNIMSIDSYAFGNTSALKTVNFCGSKSDWEALSISYGNDVLTTTPLKIKLNYNATRVVKPAQMVNFNAAVSGTNAKLTWFKNPSATKYLLVVKKDGKQILSKTLTVKTTTYTVADYDKTSDYLFTITPVNGTVKGSAASIGLPGKVKDVKATAGNSNIKLTWTKSTVATSYKVWTSTDGGSVWKLQTTTKTPGCDLTGLKGNTSYKIRIIGYRGNVGGTAAVLTIKTKGKVLGLTATPDVTKVKLTWKKNTSASYYKIFVMENNKWVGLKKTTGNATVAYTATGLVPNTAYKFRVGAYDKNGKLFAYTDISAKTKAGTVGQVKVKSATKTAVTLGWAKYSIADTYKVFIWKDGKWTVLTQTKNNTTLSYTAKGLKANTAYKFRITAYKGTKAVAVKDITARTAS